jgi:hypothetical protein
VIKAPAAEHLLRGDGRQLAHRLDDVVDEVVADMGGAAMPGNLLQRRACQSSKGPARTKGPPW